MLIRRYGNYRLVFGVLLLLMNLAGRHLSAQQPQPDSSRSVQQATSALPVQATAGNGAARELYQQFCMKCHGKDGTGNPARGLMPDIPDFTVASWQARRSEAQLLVSILDGKGPDMPPARAKCSEKQARGLVAYVRAFAPPDNKSGRKGQKAGATGNFEESYRQLQGEMDELQRQSRKASEASADSQRFKPSEPSRRPVPSEPAEFARSSASSKPRASSPDPAPAEPPHPAAAKTPAACELYRQHCEKCHGADGTGSEVRGRQPEIPNFTNPAWQARRTDAKLLANIRDGKGNEMPPWREKISEEQARGLVGYIRDFAPAKESLGQEEKEQPAPTESAEGEKPIPVESAAVELSDGFAEKLIRWLGRFHPATVHFPIALLTAAAVAGVLRLATGRSVLDSISRFCIWFGALSAVGAGTLGWFCGGLRLTDSSWILMTHRWVGTSTVAFAGLVLVLSEVSRQPDRRRTRMGFRVALLTVAALVLFTGFLGGALTFGLDHYTWPP